MTILMQLSSVALKGAGGEAMADGAKVLVGLFRTQFADNSQRLPRALQRSSDRAWRAAEIALAGDSWWDRCKLTLSSAQERAFRNQVQAFLKAHPLDGVDGHGPDFRAQCIAQLQAARKAGILLQGRLDPDELAKHVGDLSRFGDKAGVIDAEYEKLAAAAVLLRKGGYGALATFLELRPASGPPLLLSAMRYFFQREVEADKELFQGLAYARLESLAEEQSAGFDELGEAMDRHAGKLESLLADIQSVVVQTRDDVLDMKAELSRQGRQMQEFGQAVLTALEQHKLERRELASHDSLSVRDEEERRLVKDLVKRYRALPADQRKQMPALLNGVAKLQVVAGEFESADRDFRELGQIVPGDAAKADAAYNLYRTALERRAWGEALAAFTEAVQFDPARFAPFPITKFEPEKILGAGGFGVAFLCRNRNSGGQVVIKTLRRDGLDRDLGEVFREAQALEALDHPAIIRVRDCDYADPGRTRPYLVMDYFPGLNLHEYVEKHGQVPTRELLPLVRLAAEGLLKAHGKGILHRDVKPANLLVRRGGGKGGEGWDAKLIDFGLAMRADASHSTMKASMDRTLVGSSIAGTIEYAAPEQMGKLKGVPVGTYSDVYGFGKTCCYALFGTAQPTYQHWQQIPRELADLLGRCLSEQPKGRPQDFAQVIAELDRLMKPREVPVPKALPAVVPVLDAVPVETKPRRVEPPKPRREEPRPRVEKLQEVIPVRHAVAPLPRKKRSGWPMALFIVLLMMGAGVASAWYFRGGLNFPVRPAGGGDGGFTGRLPGIFGGGNDDVKYEPYKPDEFKKMLPVFAGKPSEEWLTKAAGRLAVTEPTRDQLTRHELFKTTRKMWKQTTPACTKQQWDKVQEEDDILQVSRGLKGLTGTRNLQGQKNVVRALQKWGTDENIDGLITLTAASSYGADVVRWTACEALARFPKEQRAADAVAVRLTSGWPPEAKVVTETLIKWKDKEVAEQAILNCFGRPSKVIDTHTGMPVSFEEDAKQRAIAVLKEIGSQESYQLLAWLQENPWCKNAAIDARRSIEARCNKK